MKIIKTIKSWLGFEGTQVGQNLHLKSYLTDLKDQRRELLLHIFKYDTLLLEIVVGLTALTARWSSFSVVLAVVALGTVSFLTAFISDIAKIIGLSKKIEAMIAEALAAELAGSTGRSWNPAAGYQSGILQGYPGMAGYQKTYTSHGVCGPQGSQGSVTIQVSNGVVTGVSGHAGTSGVCGPGNPPPKL